MPTKSDLVLEQAVEGKMIYFLALIVLVQFIYPMTEGNFALLLLYQFLYISMMVVGIIIGRGTWTHRIVLVVAALCYLAAGTLYAFNPQATWANFITYAMLIPYQGMLIWLLGRFLSIAKTITRDVLYAAIALYLLLGGIFVPIYGLLETSVPGSFRDTNVSQIPVQWQQFIYFSYTTLTSSGYGDILPLSWWARALANLEMIAGVMFITIVMARLVALHSSKSA